MIMLVNTLPAMEALEEYITWRIEQNNKTLQQVNDFNEILRVQGAIRELQRFSKLRDEVLQDAE